MKSLIQEFEKENLISILLNYLLLAFRMLEIICILTYLLFRHYRGRCYAYLTISSSSL